MHISGLTERSSGHDERLGVVLRDLRSSLGISQRELAMRVQADVRVVDTLERGNLKGLHDWADTERVIVGLCRMVAVDHRPILRRIIEQTSVAQIGMPPMRTGPRPGRAESGDPRTEPAARTAAVSTAPSGVVARPVTGAKIVPAIRKLIPGANSRRRGRVLMVVATPMIMIAAGVWTVQTQPRALHAAISVLPRSIAQPIRERLNALTLQLAPRKDGLRWIEVADPRTRKSDKLAVHSR